ncbi:MAG: hypothetical protein ABR577_16525 [Pyrinomonadaceae bacterium]
MLRKSSLPNSSGFLAIAVIAVFALSFAVTYSLARLLSDGSPKSAASLTTLATDKDRDGLLGPVEKVRTEVAKLSNKSGNFTEGTRELMETASYNPDGSIVDRNYYPVSGNSKPGKEEYTYDDKGNINGKTVRDNNNSIVGKESYTYQYDAVGNWTKLITSRLVYEDNQQIQKPLEVAYRKITYYFDQSIADLAQSPSNKENFGQQKDDLAQLRGALDAWIAATNARDTEKLLSFYDSRMDVFYLARNVSQSFVLAEKNRLFQRANVLDIRAAAPEITVTPDGRTAIMRFRKSYLIKDDRRIREGEVLQQLRWQRAADGWKLTGERDEQVIR